MISGRIRAILPSWLRSLRRRATTCAPRERSGSSPSQDLIFGQGLTGNPGRHGLVGREPVAGERGPRQSAWLQMRRQGRVHLLGERESQVDLGQAPVSPVGPHDHAVMDRSQHGAAGEGVPVDRRDGIHIESEDPTQERVHTLDEPGGVGARSQPLQVNPVGKEFPRSCGDECTWAFTRFDHVQRRVHRPEKGWIETIFAFVHVEHMDGSSHLELNHQRGGPSLLKRTMAALRRSAMSQTELPPGPPALDPGSLHVAIVPEERHRLFQRLGLQDRHTDDTTFA
jgi:hypothetical protein